jgi:hypothetical protein
MAVPVAFASFIWLVPAVTDQPALVTVPAAVVPIAADEAFKPVGAVHESPIIGSLEQKSIIILLAAVACVAPVVNDISYVTPVPLPSPDVMVALPEAPESLNVILRDVNWAAKACPELKSGKTTEATSNAAVDAYTARSIARSQVVIIMSAPFIFAFLFCSLKSYGVMVSRLC